jgi:uncharacterized protein YjbJ (UPF0337 family)
VEDKAKGRMKEAAGAVTGDEDKKAEGQAQQRKGAGLTPNERTTSAYATAVSSIVACSYSDGLR